MLFALLFALPLPLLLPMQHLLEQLGCKDRRGVDILVTIGACPLGRVLQVLAKCNFCSHIHVLCKSNKCTVFNEEILCVEQISFGQAGAGAKCHGSWIEDPFSYHSYCKLWDL